MRLLRKHWRFLVVLVVSIGFVMYAANEVSPVDQKAKADTRSAQSTLKRYVGDVMSDVAAYGKPANVAVVQRRAMRDELHELSNKQAQELGFQLAGDYNIDALGPDADNDQRSEFYLRRLDEVVNSLRLTRFWEPVIVGREGMPPAVGYEFALEAGPGRTTLQHKLLRLDILRRVASAAHRSKVTVVQEFTFLPDGSLNALEQRLPSAQRNANPNTPGALPMLRAIGSTLKVLGTQTALLNFLSDLQQTVADGMPGRALAVEQFKIAKEDWKEPEDTLVTLEATLVAYAVAPDVELGERSLMLALEREKTRSPDEHKPDDPDKEDPFDSGANQPEQPEDNRRRR